MSPGRASSALDDPQAVAALLGVAHPGLPRPPSRCPASRARPSPAPRSRTRRTTGCRAPPAPPRGTRRPAGPVLAPPISRTPRWVCAISQRRRAERALPGAGGRGRCGAPRRGGGAAAARAAAGAAAAGGGGAAGGELVGEVEVGGELGLEADVDVVHVCGVGEVAGAVDRERGADLVGADGGVEARELGSDLAGQGLRGRDDLAVDGGDVEAASVGVVGDRAARRELGSGLSTCTRR